MQTISFYLIALILIYGCDSNIQRKKLEIKPLHPYYTYIPEGTTKIKVVYFWVDGFNNDSSQVNSLVDYAKNKFIDSSILQEYSIRFYRHSDEINNNFKSREGDLIEWHKKDLILDASFVNGTIQYAFRYKDGVLLDNTSDVEIISIKPTSGTH
ncbi:MAG: hypothetical protein LCH51_04065 [Bacteroidetes bacterium]|nr:hypothetical protein [Bacteroidota bacterium]